MSQFILTEKPPKHWSELCSHYSDLFNSAEWQDLLSQGFGNKTLYGWDEKSSTGMTITVFRAGPFRIGYLGFPVGGIVANGAPNPDIVSSLMKIHFPTTLHCLRIPVSAFATDINLQLSAKLMPETAIERLQEWCPDVNKKLRQDLNRAKRSPLQLIDAYDDTSHSSIIFGLYKEMVARHGGIMRYSKGYFEALINLAKVHPLLRCILAVKDQEVAGFVVVACHKNTAYDLHCYINQNLKKYNTSDLLTHEGIRWAKEQGMECYNLMASQEDRPLLVRYKEKWGGVTREQKTYELVLRPVQTAMFKAASNIYQRASLLLR